MVSRAWDTIVPSQTTRTTFFAVFTQKVSAKQDFFEKKRLDFRNFVDPHFAMRQNPPLLGHSEHSNCFVDESNASAFLSDKVHLRLPAVAARLFLFRVVLTRTH